MSAPAIDYDLLLAGLPTPAELDDLHADDEPPPWGPADADRGLLTDTDILALACNSPRPSASSIEWLALLRPRRLDAGQRIDYLVALERCQRWLSALHVQALALIDRRDDSPERSATEEVACALQLTPRHAQSEVGQARRLVDCLPTTNDALARGDISARHAAAICEGSAVLDNDVLRDYEDRVLARAPEQTVPALKASIRRAQLALDPVTAEGRRQRAAAGRAVTRAPLPDGMAELRWIAPAPDIEGAWQRLCSARRLLPTDDHRTADQQRSDLLVDAILTGLPLDALPAEQGRAATIHVHINVSTLLGLDEHPGALDGHGPITAEQVRQMAFAADARWARIFTDPVSGDIRVDPRRYRPPRRLADEVIARDVHCAFPGCHQSARHCDLDHVVPFDGDRGLTEPHNLAPLCRRHHQLKTKQLWRYETNGDGSWTWTSDTGHRYVSQPPDWARLRDPDRPVPSRVHTRPMNPFRDEDNRYRALKNRLRAEIWRETRAGRREAARAAKGALRAARRQRRISLRLRREPDFIPF